MERDVVAALQQRIESDGFGARSGHDLSRKVRVVRQDAHSQRSSTRRHRTSDASESHDPQRGARDPMDGHAGGDAPFATPEGGIVRQQLPRLGEEERDHMLGDLIHAVVWDVGHGDATRRRLGDRDVVDTHAVASDDPQARRRPDYLRGHQPETGIARKI